MRTVSKILLVVVFLCCLALTAAPRANAATGITLSPAMLQLSLPEGASEQTANFTVTNGYDAPVSLAFVFERPLDQADNGQDPANILTVSQNLVTLGAGQTATQTVSLRDRQDLRPGSHRAELVVSVVDSAGADVSVRSSVRMPVTIVKESGAVSSLQLAGFSRGGVRLTPPSSIETMLTNDGNVVAIPRGVITVHAPGGKVIGQGVLNTASQAVSPGTDLRLMTQMEKLSGAVWPGLYKVDISYGLGGGQPAKTATYSYLYVAWWHLLAAAMLALAAYWGLRHIPSLKRKRRLLYPPPGRFRLTGRGRA